MKAKRENKVYSINTEQEKQRYLKEGYDIYTDNGELLEHSPQKMIRYSLYDLLMKENTALHEKIKTLEKENTALHEENDTLRKEVEVFKANETVTNNLEIKQAEGNQAGGRKGIRQEGG